MTKTRSISSGKGKVRKETRVFLSHHEDYQSYLKGCDLARFFLEKIDALCGRERKYS